MAEMTIQQAMDLALQHHRSGNVEMAEHIYRQILSVAPNHPDALNNIGVAMQTRRRFREAEQAFRAALQAAPNFPDAWSNLGECLRTQRRLDEAIAALTRASELAPNSGEVFYNLGTALDDARRHDEAIAAQTRAIALRPNDPLTHLNLAASLMARDRYTEAVEMLQRAAKLDPSSPMIQNNLAHAFLKTGQIEKSIEYFFRAAELDGQKDLSYSSNGLLAMHYRATLDAKQLFEAHRGFGALAAKLAPVAPPRRTGLDPNRRLRVAYLSPDFYRHSVAFFSEPILRHHDRSGFEIVCYSDTIMPDIVTNRLRPLAAQWFDISPLNDDELAHKIAGDNIDILVDLAGHTARNRLGVFARRAAPVQVNYLGYPNTTGLVTMDYRITDNIVDPPGAADEFHTERLFRLPRPMWCYSPAANSPPVGPLPAERNGFVTFGCFNALTKMNEPLMGLWSQILSAVPGSKLRIKTGAFRDDDARRRASDMLVRSGIDPSRFTILPPIDEYTDHLSAYGEIDLSLDTFPYHGTTTTCDALWMGAAVLTLAGEMHVSRVGVSLLSAVGLTDWIADSPEAYVRRAIEAAGDLASLAALRGQLRQRMAASPIMDGAGLTRELERAYRTMWQRYCAADKTP